MTRATTVASRSNSSARISTSVKCRECAFIAFSETLRRVWGLTIRSSAQAGFSAGDIRVYSYFIAGQADAWCIEKGMERLI